MSSNQGTGEEENPYQIPERAGIEAYISQGGFICLKQEKPHEAEPHVVSIWPSDIPVIISWLQALRAETDATTHGEE